MIWLAVAAGGAAGTLARFALGQFLPKAGFPFATLAINVIGSFVLGALAGWLPARHASPILTAALTVGVCGGFTTMSTFAYETVSLAENGAPGRAAAYAALSLALCVSAAAGGLAAGRAAAGP
jgi:CrcB protein